MTVYATHRFSIGQPVTHFAASLTSCEVIAQIGGAEAPEHRIRSFDGSFEAQVSERELTYTTAMTSPRPAGRSVH
jgi:hypothetical protein